MAYEISNTEAQSRAYIARKLRPVLDDEEFENLESVLSTKVRLRDDESRPPDWLKSHPGYVLIRAFNWENTPQGQNYWIAIHNRLGTRLGDILGSGPIDLPRQQ